MAANNDPSPRDECADVVRPGLCVRLKSELPAIKQRLRDRHPPPTFRELRRHRKNIYVALHLELIEDGFEETAAFLSELIAAEEDREARFNDGQRRKLLRDAPEGLETILDALRCIEKPTVYRVSMIEAAHGLLRDSVGFVESRPEYEWVAKHVLERALDEARKLRVIGSVELLARVLWHLGQHYAQNKQYDRANVCLSEGLQLSAGTDWLVSKSANEKLAHVISTRYCESLTAYAYEILKNDQSQARALCDKAVFVARSSNNRESLANVYASYGSVLMEMERFEMARKMFVLCLEQRRGDIDLSKTCRGELDLAECLFKMKKLDESYRHSKRAYRTAMDNGLKPELADSYAMMAKCERNLGINNWGAENYMNAVTIFNELGEFKKIRQARCFAAIAMAQGVIQPYTETALLADKERFGSNVHMEKLLNWKLSRARFWDHEDKHRSTLLSSDFDLGRMKPIIEQKADINAPEIAFGNTSDEKMVLSRQMPSESSSVYYDAEMTPPDSTALANVTDTSEKK